MYDVIGDTHGHADELVRLLEQLGYDCRRGVYSHPTRKAIFVGDFIDRGPQIRELLGLVRPMVDSGSALAVMGNHEFNALCYHTRDSQRPGGFLREHSGKNVNQHVQTILQLPPAELYDALEWFRTLPLWLELEGFRVVHACWDSAHMATLSAAIHALGGMTKQFLREASRRESDLATALEEVLKGKEIELPEGASYRDKDDHLRHEMRIKWYQSPANQTYRSYALSVDPNLPELAIPESVVSTVQPYDSSEPPLFVGHYWLHAEHPSLLAENIACLDYSVAKGGFLCAYRWDGEERLVNDKFVYVKARK